MITSVDDLRTMIRDLALDEPDPYRVTHKILMRMSPPENQVVAQVTLAHFVRETMTRPISTNPAPSSDARTASGQLTPSPKVAARVDWVDAYLRKSVNVAVDTGGNRPGDYKHLGDCDRDDCLNAATNRYRKANEVEGEAKRFELIAQELERNGVETVRELPRDVLEGLLR